MTTVTIPERIMMNEDVKNTVQFALIFVGNGPHALKNLWVPHKLA